MKGREENKICKTAGCGRYAQRGHYCYKCSNIRIRNRDIERYVYNNLKHNAKRRNKEFSISIEEFREFCKKTNYIKLRGRSFNAMSIDRINPEKGYCINNLRMVSNSDNVKLQILYMQRKKKKLSTDLKNNVPF